MLLSLPDGFQTSNTSNDCPSNNGHIFVDFGLCPDNGVVMIAPCNLDLFHQKFVAFGHLGEKYNNYADLFIPQNSASCHQKLTHTVGILNPETFKIGLVFKGLLDFPRQ